MSLPLMKNYIDGEWVESDSIHVSGMFITRQKERKSPRVAYGTAGDVDRAVKAAREAFGALAGDAAADPGAGISSASRRPSRRTSRRSPRVLTTEHGKAIDEARGEVRRMIENVEHATGVTTLMSGYTLEDIAKNIDCYGHRQPMGVFGCIAPYNFPAMVPWWFLPYAVVTGNTFVYKPSEQVPMTQTKIMEIVDEIGFPEGVINMVHGSRDVVNAMLEHPHIEGHQFRRIDTHGPAHLPQMR
jgi:malonate-semialdehyde dehydrogenase (acetylating)/methylmalonate-semialdehyde dehydrogenase